MQKNILNILACIIRVVYRFIVSIFLYKPFLKAARYSFKISYEEYVDTEDFKKQLNRLAFGIAFWGIILYFYL